MAAEPPNPVPTSDKTVTPSKKSRQKLYAGVALVLILLVALLVGVFTYPKENDGSTAKTTETPDQTVQAGQASLYLEEINPADLETGKVVKVGVYEDSGDEPVNAVQAAVKYPTDRLTFKSLKPGSAFPVSPVTDSATPGLIRFAQNIEDNSKTVKGKQLIATIEFTVKGGSGPVEVTVDKEFSLVVRSTDNKNILNAEITAE